MTDTTASPNIDANTENLGKETTSHGANALIVQGYALSAQQQPLVDFSGIKKLSGAQDSINSHLKSAKDHANFYLDTVQPGALTAIGNISGYFALQDGILYSITRDTTASQARDILKAVQEQVQDSRTQAQAVVDNLNKVRKYFNDDSGNLATDVTSLNATVNGDKGVLASISDQLDSVDKKIAGAITGVVLSGLAIGGGIAMIGVGALTEVFTGGLSTAVVVGGVAVVAAGIGGEVASSVTLAGLLDVKSKLISERSKVEAEVTLAASVAKGLKSLETGASAAADATQAMANAWNFLDQDLDTLGTFLKKGQTDVEAVRNLFVGAAQGAGKTVSADVANIKDQLTGVSKRPVIDTTTKPSDLIRSRLPKDAVTGQTVAA